jgi:hypothetical protein
MLRSHRLTVAVVLCVTALAAVTAGWAFVHWRHQPIAGSPIHSAAGSPDNVESPIVPLPGAGAGPTDPTAEFPVPRFVDVTRSTGIEFTFVRGETGSFWVPEVNGGGAAWTDVDGDGKLDLFLVNGCQLPANPKVFQHTAKLYRNDGNGKFSEITTAARVGHNGYGQGCGCGDYDNDGFDDLYVTCYGNNVLYRNNGDGTFGDVTDEVGADSPLWSSSCAFGDLDRDGSLELYVCNYVDFDPKTAPLCLDADTDSATYCGPRKFGRLPQVLLLNDGAGHLRDISQSGPTAIPPGKALGVVIADFDNDRRPDLYVANDAEPNFLLHNSTADAPPYFALEDKAVEWGAAVNEEGLSQASMGIACGDYDEDGLLDVAVTNFYLEYLTLYRNLGSAGFADVSSRTGITAETRSRMGWGTGFLDYDNDGWLDLFATNGYLTRGHKRIPDVLLPTLLRNTRHGRFHEISDQAGPYFRTKWIGRGVAFADYDNDGKTDFVVVHHYEPTLILRNETESPSHVLVLEFIGRESNRNAINVRIEAALGATPTEPLPRKIIREVIGGGSYQSASDRRISLGIGPRDRVEKLTIRWPSGRVDEFHDVAADQWLLMTEGREPRGVQSYPISEE